MPEIVAAESGPQGQAAPSWNVLEAPSVQERTGAPQFGDQQDKSDEAPKPEDTHELREETSGQTESEQQQQGREGEKAHKGEKLTRYERQKRKRAALEAREAQIAAREAEFAQKERAALEAQARANQPPYTIGELKQYRKTWEREGNFDLVEKADA